LACTDPSASRAGGSSSVVSGPAEWLVLKLLTKRHTLLQGAMNKYPAIEREAGPYGAQPKASQRVEVPT